MKQPNKIVIILVSIPILILLFFSTNIYGYFRFKSYCSSEGGLRVYEQLQKNVGWWAKDKYEAHVAAQLKYVGFVRYTDEKDGNTYDVRFIGKDPQRDSSFEKLPADQSKSTVYEWRHVSEFVNNELRLGKFGYEILDIKSNNILARYYSWSYSKFDKTHTIFEGPSGVSCFNEGGKNLDNPSRWLIELNTSFKN